MSITTETPVPNIGYSNDYIKQKTKEYFLNDIEDKKIILSRKEQDSLDDEDERDTIHSYIALTLELWTVDLNLPKDREIEIEQIVTETVYSEFYKYERSYEWLIEVQVNGLVNEENYSIAEIDHEQIEVWESVDYIRDAAATTATYKLTFSEEITRPKVKEQLYLSIDGEHFEARHIEVK